MRRPPRPDQRALWESTMSRLDGAPTEAFARYENDPVAFAVEVLGVTPWDVQQRALRMLAAEPQLTIRSSHGVGKTFLAAVAALWFCYSHRPSLILSTAPTARQMERMLWAEINRLWARAPVRLPGRCLNTRLEASLDQTGEGLTTNEPDKFAGWHSLHLLVIVDEAAGVPDIIYEVLQGTLTSAGCKLLLIGNPTKTDGYFASSHARWPERQKLKVCSLDSPNFQIPERERGITPYPTPWLVTPEWVAARRLEWGEDSDPWRVRVMGEFPTASPDALIELAWVEAAYSRGTGGLTTEAPRAQRAEGQAPEQYPVPTSASSVPLWLNSAPQQPRVLGLDVARYGDCETVGAIRHGDTLRALITWRGADLMTTCGKAIALARQWGCTTLAVDTVGLGGGVTDRLYEIQREALASLHDLTILPFEAGGRANDPTKFANRRAEAYWALRERYQSGALQHAEDWHRLTGQLTSLRYGYTSRGQLAIETKDELRKRGLASPDWADAVAIAFAPTGGGFCMPAVAGHTRANGL